MTTCFASGRAIARSRLAAAWAVVLLLVWAAPAAAEAGADSGSWYAVKGLNTGLAEPPREINRLTPRATVELLLEGAREGRPDRAVHALNLNLLPPGKQREQGRQLVPKLAYLLERKLLLDWEGLPDRRDGAARASEAPTSEGAAEPRPSLLVGRLALDGRSVPLRLQRLKPPETGPVWVFSAQTVENVPSLYARHRPGALQQRLPDWAMLRVLSTPIWQWLALLVLFAGSGLAAAGLRALFGVFLRRTGGGLGGALAGVAATPLALLAGALLFSGVARFLVDAGGAAGGAVGVFVLGVTTAAVIWLLIRVVYVAADGAMQRYDGVSAETGRDGPPLKTYLSAAKRVLAFVIIVIGIAAGLSQVSGFEAAGLSLLASTGAIGIIAGFAAQGFLANIISGMQIAASRPVVIGDNIVFDGEWGHVEDITYTYVVLRTWDLKRLVIPLRTFLERPFHNYTKRDSSMAMPIYLYADYRADVQALRRKYEELLHQDPDYDGTLEPYFLVTALGEETMELRAVCSARDPVKTFFLHCRLRERLVDHLRGLEDGAYLPRRRVSLVETPRRPPKQAADDAPRPGRGADTAVGQAEES